jgi:hypothetical protein
VEPRKEEEEEEEEELYMNIVLALFNKGILSGRITFCINGYQRLMLLIQYMEGRIFLEQLTDKFTGFMEPRRFIIAFTRFGH